MKRRRLVPLVALATLTLAFSGAPQVGDTPAPSAPPVATLEGAGFLGRITCYACLGGAIASTNIATAISGLVLNACLDICEVVM